MGKIIALAAVLSALSIGILARPGRSRYLLYPAIAVLTVIALGLWQRSKRPRGTSDTPSSVLAPEAIRPSTPPHPAVPTEKPAPEPATVPAVSRGQRRAVLAPLVVALIFAFLGQAIFAEGPDSPNLSTGFIQYAIAIVLFTFAAVRADHLAGAPGVAASAAKAWRAPDGGAGAIPVDESAVDDTRQAYPSLRRQPRRAALLGAVVLLTIVLLDLLRVDPPLPSYTLPFLLWLSTIGLYIRAVVPWPLPARPRTGSWLKAHWQHFLILAVIVWAAFALRVWDLEGIPPTLGGDEGMSGLESIRTITGEIRNPFITGWLSQPTLTLYINSLTIRLFGQTVFALRLPWALVGMVTVLVVFQLVRRLAGLTLALITAALLATYHYPIHFSRLGLNPIADPFFVALALLFLYRAYDRGETRDWALCGVIAGLAQFAYTGARFATAMVAIVTLSFVLRDGIPFWHKQRRGILIMVGAAVVTAAPMIQYAIRFPLDYNARINLNGIIQSGWLEREQVVRNQEALPILLDQFQRAVLAFNVYPDRGGFYASPRPLFDFASGVLFLLGLGYATLRPGDRRLFPLVAWWWGGTILGGALTLAPPSVHRLITLGPPAVFFVALALLKIAQIAQRAWTAWSPRRQALYLAAAVLAISIASVNWYFLEYTPLRVYGGYNTVVANEMATYMRDKLGSDWRVYFFGPPRIYILGFGSIPYLAPDVEGVDVVQPLTAPLDPAIVQPDRNAAFIFLPERRGELEWVRKTFPNGALEEVPSSWNGDPILAFSVYRVQIPSTQ